MSMTETELSADPPVRLYLRRSARARRFSLRVSRADGRVVLTLPPHAREAEALRFARGHLEWIVTAQAGSNSPRCPEEGALFPVGGQSYQIARKGVRYPQIIGAQLCLPARGAPGALIAGWLKAMARDRMAAASARYAAQIGCDFTGLSIRDTRSRWGSCSAAGRLMYSWRLMMAPPEVADYVAAHEVAHLREMNHSPAFWAVVAGLMPDYAPRRDWLRRHGSDLQSWQFGDPT